MAAKDLGSSWFVASSKFVSAVLLMLIAIALFWVNTQHAQSKLLDMKASKDARIVVGLLYVSVAWTAFSYFLIGKGP